MFLQEFLIIVLGLLAVMSVEFAAKVLRGWRRDILLAGQGFKGALAEDRVKLTQLLAVRFVPHPPLHSNFFYPIVYQICKGSNFAPYKCLISLLRRF